jgi:hypothetical protein
MFLVGFVQAVFGIIFEVFAYWILVCLNDMSSSPITSLLWALLISVFKTFRTWWLRKSPKDLLLENLHEANSYEEWSAAAYQLDTLLQYDLW